MYQATQNDGRFASMPMDLHTHTWHSPDGAPQTVAERIKAAAKMQLEIMAITDHVEINRWYPAAYYGAQETEECTYDSMTVFDGSADETCSARQTYAHLGVKVLCGAEVGQIPQDIELSRQVYDDPRVDVVIGSVHELKGLPDFYFLDYSAVDVQLLMGMYFEEELRLAESDCYDVLGHLTYALRYLPSRASFDLSPYDGIIDDIFRAVIARGKALELNGSGLRADVPFTDPDLRLIQRYRQLGGEYLTIGTDAHDTKHLCYGMPTLLHMAHDAGFSSLTYFERHEPKQIAF